MGVVDEHVLGLNRAWAPAAVYSVKVAVTMILRGMAMALDPETFELHDFESWVKKNPPGMRMIKTASGYLPAPEVIVCKSYSQLPPSGLSFNRHNLYQRDGYRCQYCGTMPGAGKLTIDHVLPRSRGGPTSWENCVAACSPCNSHKADRIPSEARMRLRKQPCKPKNPTPGIRVPAAKRRESWAPFLAKTRG